MRVLFTSYAEKTHFLAMAPLAWAMRTAGHDVRFASQPELTGAITQGGLTAVPVGRDHRIWRMIELNPEWLDADRGGLSEPYDIVDDPGRATWEHVSEGYAGVLTGWHKMELTPMIADLVAYARHWQPDLVIWDPSTYAGSIAAEACGAAHARLSFSVDIFGATREAYLRLRQLQPPGDRADPLGEWLAAYGRKYDFAFTEDLITGQLTVDQLPTSLQVQTALPRLPMRYVPYGGAAVVPAWLRDPPERPRVALTLGLSTTDHGAGFTVGVQEILDSLADLNVEVVATIADKARHTLAKVPDNARIVPYVPLHALAPTCAAVIHHAGPGTLCTTGLHGVPQLLLPGFFDEPALARSLAARGAGLVVDTGSATGATVRDALTRLLTEPSFGDDARSLRAEMLSAPSPNDLVADLEKLTADRRVQARTG